MLPRAMLTKARTRVRAVSIQVCLKSSKWSAPAVPASTKVVTPARKEWASGMTEAWKPGASGPRLG